MKKFRIKKQQLSTSIFNFQNSAISQKAMQTLKGGGDGDDDDIIIHDVVEG